MWDGGFNGRRLAYRTLALVLASSASAALAQTPAKQPPPPPPPDTTTVVEKPDAVPPQPTESPPAEPVTPAPTKPNAPEQKPEHVPQDASGFHLSTLETKNLTLLYIDPAQTYLTPYLARAFENSLAFHEKNLHWKPWEPVTILLKDFSDYGNAAALGSPSDMVLLDVAPLSLSMEAFSPGERFFTLMNHEITHVGTIDVWNCARFLLAALPRRQAGPAAEAPQIDPLQFPHEPTEPLASLVHGRQRGVHGDMDGGRSRPRAGRL